MFSNLCSICMIDPLTNLVHKMLQNIHIYKDSRSFWNEYTHSGSNSMWSIDLIFADCLGELALKWGRIDRKEILLYIRKQSEIHWMILKDLVAHWKKVWFYVCQKYCTHNWVILMFLLIHYLLIMVSNSYSTSWMRTSTQVI